jgi:hypothetical protein
MNPVSNSQPTPLKIVVNLPADRKQYGRLSLIDADGTVLFGPVSVLGKSDNQSAAAHGNPSRDPVKPFGDTPTGTFQCMLGKAGQLTQQLTHSYGPYGWISLDPQTGQALQAKQNGRFGLLIHGGDLNAQGRLRPTFGCIRMFNPDLGKLLQTIGKQPLTCEVVGTGAEATPQSGM